jgi:hypothetical protein
VAAFLAAANATDLVSGTVPVSNDAPAEYRLGTTTVTFVARDAAGNEARAQSQITVVTEDVAPVTIDARPPADVSGLKAAPGDSTVLLSWVSPPDEDFDHVTITRSAASDAEQELIYRGARTSFRDTGLANAVEYRYVVVTFDEAGNRSRGLVIRATPKEQLLTAPRDGAVVTGPPVLKWRPLAGATYYNVQLYRVSTTVKAATGANAAGAKILSAWPTLPSFGLKRTWKFEGKVRQLLPGRYSWYVWPGLGARVAEEYGPVMGQSSFVVKAVAKKAKPKSKKPPAKKKKRPVRR